MFSIPSHGDEKKASIQEWSYSLLDKWSYVSNANCKSYNNSEYKHRISRQHF